MPRDAAQSVHLRPVEAADLPTMFRYQLDPESCRMAVVNPRCAEAFDAHWAKILADPTVVARAILADGALAGSISCFKMEGEDCVGYWIGREHWGRRIASRALALLLAEVRTRPLHARAARANEASIRVLDRCGFRLTGYHHAPACERYPECEEAHFVLA
jgi:RimJ/RimL family protein N-acetyltransferase